MSPSGEVLAVALRCLPRLASLWCTSTRRAGAGQGGTTVRVPIASIAVIAGLIAAAAPALAQEPVWRHGIIEPKSDAGFQVMAVRAGFAARQGIRLELPYFQNDVIALRGLLAGELESYEGGAATAILAAARGGDVKIVGCHWQTVVHSVFARAEFKGRRISRARPWRSPRPTPPPT